MSSAIKAVLLSALLFPGTGHFSLKKPIQGTILAVLTLISLYFIFTSLSEITQQLTIQMQQAGVVPSVDEITNQASSQDLSTPSWIITICWVAGIIDSYRIGSLQDKEKKEQ